MQGPKSGGAAAGALSLHPERGKEVLVQFNDLEKTEGCGAALGRSYTRLPSEPTG